jgi:hypothetical protein
MPIFFNLTGSGSRSGSQGMIFKAIRAGPARAFSAPFTLFSRAFSRVSFVIGASPVRLTRLFKLSVSNRSPPFERIEREDRNGGIDRTGRIGRIDLSLRSCRS